MKLNDRRGLVPQTVVNFILGALAVVALVFFLFKVYAPAYDEVDINAESYFDYLIDEINVARKGSIGYFSLWMPETKKEAQYHVVYFGETLSVDSGSKTFVYRGSLGKNIICTCYSIEDKTNCLNCDSLKKDVLLDISRAPVLHKGVTEFGYVKLWKDLNLNTAYDVGSLINDERRSSWGDLNDLKSVSRNVYFSNISDLDISSKDYYVFFNNTELLLKSKGDVEASGITELGAEVRVMDLGLNVADISGTISNERKSNWGKSIIERNLGEGQDYFEVERLFLFDGYSIFEVVGVLKGSAEQLGLLEFGGSYRFKVDSDELYSRVNPFLEGSRIKVWGEEVLLRDLKKGIDEPKVNASYFLKDGEVWRWGGQIENDKLKLDDSWVISNGDRVEIREREENYVFYKY